MSAPVRIVLLVSPLLLAVVGAGPIAARQAAQAKDCTIIQMVTVADGDEVGEILRNLPGRTLGTIDFPYWETQVEIANNLQNGANNIHTGQTLAIPSPDSNCPRQ